MRDQRVLFFVIALLAVSTVFARDYKICMSRPNKVGQKYKAVLQGESSQEVTMSSQGKVVRENKSSVSATFEGTITVLKVDELQRAVELRALVVKCCKKNNGKAPEQEIFPQGTQIVVRRGNSKKKEYLADGKIVPKDIAKVLDLLFSLPSSKLTDDDIFGTKEAKKVGDSWPVNGALVVQDAKTEGLDFDAGSVKGKTTLEKEVVVNGTKCLLLIGQLNIEKVVIPLPKGLVVEKSDLITSFSGEFPIDNSIGRLTDKMNMTMSIVAKGKTAPNTPEITMSMKMTRAKLMKREFLSKNHR